MSQLQYLTTYPMSHENTVTKVTQELVSRGWLVNESFDLQIAKAAHTGFTCTYHGESKCDCQIAVLLVYGKPESPITLVIHSQDGKTHLSIVGPKCCEDENILANEIIEIFTIPENRR